MSIHKAGPDSKGRHRRVNRVRWWTYLGLIIAVAMCAFPLYWMFVIASSPAGSAAQRPPRMVPGLRLGEMFTFVVSTVPFMRALLNSAVVSLLVGAGQAFLAAMAGDRKSVV